MQAEISQLTAVARQACEDPGLGVAGVLTTVNGSGPFEAVCRHLTDASIPGASADADRGRELRRAAAAESRADDWEQAAQRYTEALRWAGEGVDSDAGYLGRSLALLALVGGICIPEYAEEGGG